MLHPSYSDLMKVVNEGAEDDTAVVNSRYSIVMATAKRARQIIGDKTNATEEEKAKPLSTAVRELNEGSLRIIAAETDEDETAAIAISESMQLLASAEDEGSDDSYYEDGAETEEEFDDTIDPDDADGV